MQNELRFSTPDDWRLRGIAGAYFEDNKLYDQTTWMYKNIPPCTSNGAAGTPGNTDCLSNIGTFPGTYVQNPGVQGDNTSFYQDQYRDTKQTAFFASADFDIIPKVLTITAGTRHFLFENNNQGSVLSSFGCFEAGAPAGGCHDPAYSYNLNAQNLRDTESGFKSRGNITWHITPDLMVYYTYSQGFRPGGFNQNGGAQHAIGPDGVAQYEIPRSFASDNLTNNEIGWKTEFLDHRLQWNGAVYRENWNNVQIEFFNPGVVGNLFYDTNGQNFLIKGIETSLVFRVVSGLTLQYAGSWNQSRQQNSPALIDNNPASGNYGKPITQVCRYRARQLHAGDQSVRPDRRPERRRAAASVQRARPLRVDHRLGLHRVRSGRCHPSGYFIHAGRIEPHDLGGRNRRHLEGAIRDARLFDRQRLGRYRQGSLVGDRELREPRQLQCQHLHQHRSVHRRADSPSSARHRGVFRLQILARRIGGFGAGRVFRADGQRLRPRAPRGR